MFKIRNFGQTGAHAGFPPRDLPSSAHLYLFSFPSQSPRSLRSPSTGSWPAQTKAKITGMAHMLAKIRKQANHRIKRDVNQTYPPNERHKAHRPAETLNTAL